MIPKRAVADVLRELGEAVAVEPHGVIATDADGTLWSGDVGVDAFEELLARGTMHEAAHEALRAEADACGMPPGLSPTQQARALYEAEVRGTYAGDRACAMMAWIYAGWSTAQMNGFARELIASRRLAARLQPEAIAVVRWAVERSVPVVIVSASPLAVVEAAIEVLPGPRPHIIAMTPCEEGGRLLPSVRTPLPYGPGKAEALRTHLAGRPVLAALGDSGFDAQLLQLARQPLAVRPKESLRRSSLDIARLAELSSLAALAAAEDSTPRRTGLAQLWICCAR